MNVSFEDLKALANNVASEEVMEQVSGGLANDCHDDLPPIVIEIEPIRCDNI